MLAANTQREMAPDIRPASSQARSSVRTVLIAWAVAWPAITVLLLMLDGSTADWPLALRTLQLTGLMVPTMVFVLVPILNRAVDRAIGKR